MSWLWARGERGAEVLGDKQETVSACREVLNTKGNKIKRWAERRCRTNQRQRVDIPIESEGGALRQGLRRALCAAPEPTAPSMVRQTEREGERGKEERKKRVRVSKWVRKRRILCQFFAGL